MRTSFAWVLKEIDSMLKNDSPDSREIDASFKILKMKIEELKTVDLQLYEAILETAREERLLQEVDAALSL